MASAVGGVDEMVREYLLYRGFVQTLKALEQEKKDDKDKGLRVNRIVDYILTCVHKSDFLSLQSFWNHLSKRFFSRLNHDLTNTAHKLESTILRLYLINAHRSGRHDDIRMFFERMGGALQERRDWKEWFALPYTKNPEQHSAFKIYFSKDWYDAFVVSLYNFFSIMFSGLPLPTLLQFEAEHQRIQALVTEKNLLHTQLATTKEALLEAETSVQKLEARLAHNVAQQAEKTIQKSQKQTTIKSNRKPIQNKDKKSKSPIYSPPEELKLDTTLSSGKASEETALMSPDSHVTSPDKNTSTFIGMDSFLDNNTLAATQALTELTTPQPFLVIDQQIYKDHDSAIAQCRFSPNAVHVASVDTNNGLRVWDPTSISLHTKSVAKYSMDLLSMDWVHHGSSDNLLMLGFVRGQVKLFDVASSMSLWEFAADKSYPRILSIACSSTTPTFAISAAGWHSSHQVNTSFANRITASLTSPTLPSQLTKPNELLTVSKRSTNIEFFDPTPGELSIWDINQQKVQTVLPLTPAIAVNCMSFNHNSNLLVTGGVDGMIRLFDVVQGECLCGWTAHHGEIYNIQFSSDENSVYSIGQDNCFCKWSTIRSTEKLAQYNIHNNACSPAASWEGYFPSTPPGNLFAFESEDKFVLTCSTGGSVIYQVNPEQSLTQILSLSDHTGPVTTVDWVPGRRSYSTCITGSVDSTVRVVNLLKNNI